MSKTTCNLRRLAAGALIALVTGTLPGCGAGDNAAVHGTVTLDGQPVDQGWIIFLPAGGEGGVKVGGDVVNGEFDIPADGRLGPGPHKVEVRWRKKTGRVLPATDPPNVNYETREAVPARYNSQTTLSVDLEPGDNEVAYDLKSKT